MDVSRAKSEQVREGMPVTEADPRVRSGMFRCPLVFIYDSLQ
jgi:hypothetical protein